MRILALLAPILIAAALTVPDGSVFYAGVATNGGKPTITGLAFVAAQEPTPVLISALSIAGDVPGDALTARVDVSVTEAFARQEAFKATDAMAIAGASVDEVAANVMVWTLPTNKKGRVKSQMPLKPLTLAEDCPREGATIWLASPLIEKGGRGGGGKVLKCDARTIEVRLDGAHSLTRSVGGPILDRGGDVVGMLVSGEKPSGGATVAVGVSVEALLAHLAGEPLGDKADDGPVAAETLEQVQALGSDPWANPWGVDLQALHTELLPAWAGDDASEADVKAAMGDVPEIPALFARIARLSFGDAMTSYDEITRVLEEWSGFYAEEGVRLTVRPAKVKADFTFLVSWQLHSAVLEGRSVHLQARLDDLESREPLLEWTEAGALIVSVARAQEIALGHLWPALALDSGHPRASALRDELDEALGTTTMALLLTSSKDAQPGASELPAELDPGVEVALMNLVAYVTRLTVQAASGGPEDDDRKLWAAYLGRPESHQGGAMIVCGAAAAGDASAKAVADELGVCEGTGEDVLERVRRTIGKLGEAELHGLPDALPIRIPRG
ncbi:MAG: hypothetical protein GY898_12905 [Proteobacteria bacterium]|nr:hypothetical protein [Pseudomonadota bacterium]